MPKRHHRKGLKDCLCGCGIAFIPKKKDHNFYSNKCRYRYWTPIRRDLNRTIKKLDHVTGVILDLNRVTLDISQYIKGLDKRIKTLEGLISAQTKEGKRQEKQYQAHLKYNHREKTEVTGGKPTIYIMPDKK